MLSLGPEHLVSRDAVRIPFRAVAEKFGRGLALLDELSTSPAHRRAGRAASPGPDCRPAHVGRVAVAPVRYRSGLRQRVGEGAPLLKVRGGSRCSARLTPPGQRRDPRNGARHGEVRVTRRSPSTGAESSGIGIFDPRVGASGVTSGNTRRNSVPGQAPNIEFSVRLVVVSSPIGLEPTWQTRGYCMNWPP